MGYNFLSQLGNNKVLINLSIIVIGLISISSLVLIITEKNNISDQNIKIDEYLKGLENINDSISTIISQLQSESQTTNKNIQSLSNDLTSLQNKTPNQTRIQGPYKSKLHRTTITTANLINGYAIFPTVDSCTVTLTKPSVLTLIMNGHMKCTIQVEALFLKDDNPISVLSELSWPFGTAYNQGLSTWISLNIANQRIYQPGTFNIKFGLLLEGVNSCDINAGEFWVLVQEIN